jgi:uncharacterized protein YndB with AHSA1/START domain
MLRKILIGFVVFILVLVIVIATRPSTFSVTRSASIAAPPARVFEKVNDLHQWENWSPWAKLDPAMKQIYSGSPSGRGAVYHWLGNKEVGEGEMAITESRAPELVQIKLDFIKPFPSTSTTLFTFKPEGGGTVVTWNMAGDCNFMTKAFRLIADMDKMIGGQFEQGLSQLKTLSEKPAN